MPFCLCFGASALQLDLDVDAGGKIELHERVYRLRRGIDDVEKALIRANFELFTRFFIDVRRAVHGELLDARRHRDRTADLRARALRRIGDLAELDERALFHLINLAREEGAFVLITSRSPLATFPVAIRDLGSRLRALPRVALTAPDDALLRKLIVKLAADRQLTVDEGVVNYLVNRIERSFAGARAAVVRLDEESMRQHRPVTRVLAAELFKDTTA